MVRVLSMAAADETEVVAAPLAGRALARVVLRCWDEGWAVLPLDPNLPLAERDRLLAALRPTLIDDGELRTRARDGVPTRAGVVAVVATSGTTGVPKGVELTRIGMEAMGRGYCAGVGATRADNWLACLPLHHVASLGVLARSVVTGVPYTVHDTFDADRVARSPREDGTTIVSLVPTTVRRLLDAGAPLHEYRCVIIGGAPCPPALRARAEAAGVTVFDAYGLSETWSGCALNGVPIDGAEISLEPETGEILVRGDLVMRGYRLDAARTAEVLEPDRTLHTGDVGEFVDGRLYVIDRLKDLVITGGVNVSPTEIEGVLGHHPAVADVCVIGAPDDDWGERVVAYVVATAPLTLEELRAFAREQLSAPKLPRELRVVNEIPRSASGKALRRELRC
jgi:O-succinylbenzoic acid--CoA ligase